MKKFLVAISTILTFTSVAQTPTFSSDVASIIYNKCASCHHEGAIGGFSLTSYAAAFSTAVGIKDAVENKRMPPWPPDPAYRRFAHERFLTQDQIDKIVAWVDGGAPEGDPNVAPEPPTFSETAWLMPNPDFTAKIPDYFSTAASGDIYQCFAIPTNLSQERYIKNIEIVPGNRSVVHHVLVFADDSGQSLTLDANSPGPGYLGFGGTGTPNSRLLGAWVPGQGLIDVPNGFGKKIGANSALVLQIHYPAGSAGQLDSTRVNIQYTTNNNVREMLLAPVLNHGTNLINGPLAIPANQTRSFKASFTVEQPATAFNVAPHMHLIGRSIKTYATLPNGDTLNIIDIPKWDFKWQGSYTFQYAQVVPAGTTLWAEAFYDNTINNPFNPNSPPQEVSAGEATDEEMMLVYFSFAGFQVGDNTILLDSSLIASVPLPTQDLQLSVYPNPANSQLYVYVPNTDTYTVELYNTLGQRVLGKSITIGDWIDTATLPRGIYNLYVQTSKGKASRRVVLN